MEAAAKIIDALASLVWPTLILFAVHYFRSDISSLFHLLRQHLASGGAVKWRDFEFKGVDISSFEAREGKAFERRIADREIFQRRHNSYQSNKNLFLVHRVRPTGRNHSILNLPTYDVSVYLIPHKNFGHLNDVKEVEYYFGQHFGRSEGEFGTKYVVQNGSEGFAVQVNAYGPMLCEARILFHDGTETTVSRYLDFEGTGYQFRNATNAGDAVKLQRGEEENNG